MLIRSCAFARDSSGLERFQARVHRLLMHIMLISSLFHAENDGIRKSLDLDFMSIELWMSCKSRFERTGRGFEVGQNNVRRNFIGNVRQCILN